MKTIGIVLFIATTLLLIANVYNEIYGNYEYSKKFESSWNLADKASTIPQKAKYVDNFIQAIEGGGFTGKFNAIFMETPDNSFDENLKAVKSLQGRLHEIYTMDVTSFQYQTAIQQITAQEQGEAKAMLHVFEGIWWKENHFWLWNWVGGINWTLAIILLFVGAIIWMEDSF